MSLKDMNEEEFRRVSNASWIWKNGRDPRGTLAETYLNKFRKLQLPPELAGTVLRFHEKCPWYDKDSKATTFVPALIVPFRQIKDSYINGIHRVALNPDGSKIDRRMLGLIGHAAIKLDSLSGSTLVVGEGLETCLAARELGLKPVWALGSVGAISFFPLIDGIKQLIILGEKGKESERAIRICGRRWERAGRRVKIAKPTGDFSDLNDALIAERIAQ
jgi:putative DNA primase/helicase